MDKELLFRTFRNTAAAAIYIYIVSLIMQNGDILFGDKNSDIKPFVALMLFCLSAAVVGGLLFGESAYLFFDNRKIAAIKAAIYSVAWLGVYTVIGLLVLATV